LNKYILMLTALFISPVSFCSQVTISNTSSSDSAQIQLAGHLNSSANAPITFTVSKSVNSPYETDNTAIQCLDTDLIINDAGKVHQPIHPGDTLDASISGDLSVDGTVKNTCEDHDLDTNLWLYDVVQGTVAGYHHNLKLPALSSCSVVVNTSPNFDNVNSDTDNNTLALTTEGKGTGTLIFSPDSSSSGYGLLKNGQSTIPYSVTDTVWDVSKSEWTGNLKDHDLELGNIPQGTKSGVYSGKMNVTIACE